MRALQAVSSGNFSNFRQQHPSITFVSMPTRPRPYSLLFVTTSLDMGGAQMMLVRLLTGLDRNQFSPTVISLVRPGPLQAPIEGLGIPIYSLEMPRGIPHPGALVKLVRWLRRNRPDAIQTWMYHADLLGGLAAKLAGGIPLAWGIRHADLSKNANRWHTLLTVKACAHLSRWLPSQIICSSEAARRLHVEAGYEPKKMVVVRNGVDLTLFQANAVSRSGLREELGVPDESLLVGLIGRFDPQKDHRNFVLAAGLLLHMWPHVRFVLCGERINWDNASLTGWIDEQGIRDRCYLLDNRDDMPRVMAAMDIVVSSSLGESFPNVVAEAMSCEVPCVVTDVGDSAVIVGDTGRVVPPRDPIALSAAMFGLITMNREMRCQLGMTARCRIEEHFALHTVVSRYQNLYGDLAGRSTSKKVQRVGHAR